MTNINVTRVALGGFVAGVIIFVTNGIVNGGILSGQFETWALAMGSLVAPPARAVSMCLWTLMCMIFGTVGVWIYAAIRPRYGAGRKPALLAGLLLWIPSKLAVSLDFVALGLLPGRIIVGQLIGGFVAILLGVYFGARFYRD
jgi:hypothetical protein